MSSYFKSPAKNNKKNTEPAFGSSANEETVDENEDRMKSVYILDVGKTPKQTSQRQKPSASKQKQQQKMSLTRSAELISDVLKDQKIRVVSDMIPLFSSEDMKTMQRYLVKKDRFKEQDEVIIDCYANNPKDPLKRVQVTVVSMVEEGRFATVYAVIRENVEAPMALKIETLKGRSFGQIQNEAKILKELTEKYVADKLAKLEKSRIEDFPAKTQEDSSTKGSGQVILKTEKYFRFPFFKDWGRHRGRACLLMSLLGGDLNMIRKKIAKPLCYRSILLLAIETLTALTELHHNGYIHRDINPKNFCVGFSREDREYVHLVDLGIAVRADKSTPPARREDYILRDRASQVFCSLEAHKCQALTKKSDLTSWIFVIVDLCERRALTWRSLSNVEKITEAKKTFLQHPEKLSDFGIPNVVADLMRCLVKLDAQNPDHSALKKILRDAVKAQDPIDAAAPTEWKNIEL